MSPRLFLISASAIALTCSLSEDKKPENFSEDQFLEFVERNFAGGETRQFTERWVSLSNYLTQQTHDTLLNNLLIRFDPRAGGFRFNSDGELISHEEYCTARDKVIRGYVGRVSDVKKSNIQNLSLTFPLLGLFDFDYRNELRGESLFNRNS